MSTLDFSLTGPVRIDSLSVHKARLQRGHQVNPPQHDSESDGEPDSPTNELAVQGRVDSIALAQKRLGLPGLQAPKGPSQPVPRPPPGLPKMGKAKVTRFQGAPPTGPPKKEKDASATPPSNFSAFGKKIAGKVFSKKKEAGEEGDEPGSAKASSSSTHHVKFSDAETSKEGETTSNP